MAMRVPPALRALAAAGFAPSVFALYKLSFSKQKIFEQVLLNLGISFLGFLLTRKLIPILKPICLKRGLFGKDINKKGTSPSRCFQAECSVLCMPTCRLYTFSSPVAYPAGTEAGEKQIPESLGLAPGVVFLICLTVSQQLQSYDFWGTAAWIVQGARQDANSGWVRLVLLQSIS